MKNSAIVLFIMCLILSVIAYIKGGFQILFEGFTLGGITMINVAPMLLFAFLIVGLFPAIISKEQISNQLGKSAGKKGILLSLFLGGLFPGGPYAFYPILKQISKSGASPGAIFGFLSAKNLWDVTRFPLEIAIIGPFPAFIRKLITLPFPLLVSIISNYIPQQKFEQIIERDDT